MARNKVNPRKIPVSMADVERAKKNASDDAVHLALAIFLTVLKDDFGFDNEQVKLARSRVDKLSEEVAERRVSIADLLTVLREEYHIDLLRDRKDAVA